MKRKTSFPFAFRSLIRTFELRSKVLPLENTQIYLVFSSLIRTFALWKQKHCHYDGK